MVKKLFRRFIGTSLLTIITLAVLGRTILIFLDKHKNIIDGLKSNLGVMASFIILVAGSFLLCYIISYILYKMFKLGVKINKKCNLVAALSYRDFIASISILFFICSIVILVLLKLTNSKFNGIAVFITIASFIISFYGIHFYKEKIQILKENGYRGLGLIGRFILNYLFGILSFPLLFPKIIVWMVYGVEALAKASEGMDIEYGSFTDSNGKVNFYSNIKSKDEKGNTYHEDMHYKDSKGKDHYISKTKF